MLMDQSVVEYSEIQNCCRVPSMPISVTTIRKAGFTCYRHNSTWTLRAVQQRRTQGSI